MQNYALNRWNWSQKSGKWVFVTKGKNGRRKYFYQVHPPNQFIEITEEISKINRKLMVCDDSEEARKLFSQIQELGKQLQAMGR